MHEGGLFIALEGSDGAGKSTQIKLLEARLTAVGYDVEVVQFPKYSSESSYFIRKYLAGEFGPASEVSAYSAAIFYALDRFDSAEHIKKLLKKGKIVLADRYVGSNMAHQGSKFSAGSKKRGFFLWVENLEFETLGSPRPNINFYLHLPSEISHKRIKSRSKKTGVKADEHEKDKNHIEETIHTYETLCKLFPKDFVKVDCAAGGKQFSVKVINDELWRRIKPLLPVDAPHKPKEVVIRIDAGLLAKKKKSSGKKRKK